MEIKFAGLLLGLLPLFVSSAIGAMSPLCGVKNGIEDGKDSGDNNITIAVLLPIYPCKGHVAYPFFLQMAGPAISIALERVKSTYLSGRNVSLITMDSECDLASAQFVMIDLMFTNPVDVVLGPGLEYVVSAVSRLLGRWDIPQITAGGLAAGFTKHGKRLNEFSTLTRVQGPNKKLAGFVSRYFSSMGWNHSKLIFFDNEKVVNDCKFGIGPIYNLNIKAGLTGTSYKLIDGREEDFTYQQIKDLLLNIIRPVARGKQFPFLFSIHTHK